MPIIERLLILVETLTLWEVTIGLVIVSALIMIVQDRRLSLIPMLLQYLLIGLMVGAQLYRPLLFVRASLGLVICILLYITAGHVQQALQAIQPSLSDEDHIWRSPAAPTLRAIHLVNMGSVFRLLATAFGALIAYGMWRAYPLHFVPTEVNLTFYLLISMGILLTLTGVEPLRVGLGLLTCMNGFEMMYLFLEQSLVVIGLLGIVQIIVAASIAIFAEHWLESLQGEAHA